MSATTTSRAGVRRRLQEFRRGDGNWRLKALLLAALDTGVPAAAVGAAWPRERPRSPADYVHLGARHRDSAERALARSVYDRDAIEAGEAVPRDEYTARALTSESATELDVLWREELLATVQIGADVRRMARDAATVHDVGARKGDLPVQDATPFATTGAEGARAAFDEASFQTAAYDCDVHEQGFAVTDRLVDQSEVGQIEYEIRRAGEAVENAINRQFINELLDNATNHDADLSGSGNTDVRDLLLKASEAAADNDFDPTDTLVAHPEYASELFGNNQLAVFNAVRSDAGLDEDAVVGHEIFVQSGTAYDSGSQTYGFESDGEHGALVYGRQFVHVPVYRDVSVSELAEGSHVNFVRDLQGGVARADTDVVAVDDDADGTYESVVRVQR